MKYRERIERGAIRRTAVTTLTTLGLSLLAPVTAAQAGPEIGECKPIEESKVQLSQIMGRVPLERVREMLHVWSQNGVIAQPDELVAYLVPTPGEEIPTIVIGTGETGFVLCPVADPLDASRLQYETVGIATESPLSASDYGVTPSVNTTPRQEQSDPHRNGNWRTNNSDCFYVNKEQFDRDVCWHHDQQRPDEDGQYHHRQFYAGTIGSGLNGVQVERMWVEAQAMSAGMCGYCTTSADQYWDGLAKPEADHTGSENCLTDTLSLTISGGVPVQVGISRGVEITTCERYLIQRYGNEAGHRASIWEGNPSTSDDRSVGLNMPIKTRETDTRPATWYLLTGQRVAD